MFFAGETQASSEIFSEDATCTSQDIVCMSHLQVGIVQRRCDMRHELLTQRAFFVLESMQKKWHADQHFVTRVVPPLGIVYFAL